MALLRILGVAFGIAVIIGSTIGAGILRTPGTVVGHVGSLPLAFLVWTLGGLYALLGASVLAELATAIPKSGGFYVFARRALGEGPAFLVGAADWFSNTAFIAYGAVALGEYAELLGLPQGRAWGAASIVGFTAIQLLGMRLSSRVQEVTSFLKAIAFVALIALLLTAAPAAADAAVLAPRGASLFVGLVLATQLVVGAYDGWQSATYFAGEDRDPARNLPRAFIGGVLLVMAVYLLMNAALMRVLPPAQMAASPLPAADAARLVFGSAGETIITALSMASLLPLVSAVLLNSTRILYALGEDGVLPRRLGVVGDGGTPAAALVVSALVALLFLTTPSFDVIAGVAAVFAVVSYVGAFVSLIVLRRREPELPRPFRSWGYPWTTGVVLSGAVLLLAGMAVSATRESLFAVVALILGYAVHRLTRH